ncbi:MAG TPA: DUF4215 domain-containing protein [Polyangiaceae bacterium]|nr:DUF4215 domain-containing protein [Polyangiaceae bacterium]
MKTIVASSFFLVLVGVAACSGKPEVVQGSGSQGGTGGSGAITDAGTGGNIFGNPDTGCAGSCTGDSGVEGGTSGDAAPLPYCGDKKLDPTTESCDDGNTTPGDGCSATCVREADWVCPIPGAPCLNTVVCGDGKIGGTEQCDDHNGTSLDGCDSSCQLEPGWACPYVGIGCVAAKCGDGIVAGVESCDDGSAGGDAAHDGCDDHCQLEDGFKCDPPGTPCTPTTCGDGKAEGTEQCDDGNLDLGDGCTPRCKLEPNCDDGPCTSQCGDGIILGDEKCDDGNKRNGDGCSDQCQKETGFECTQAPLADTIDIPLVVRDFQATDPNPAVNAGPPADYAAPNHVDFELVNGSPNEPSGDEDGAGTHARIVRSGLGASPTGRGLDLGAPGETFGIRNLEGSLIAVVPLRGKPVYALSRVQCDKTALPSEANGWSKCTKTTMDLDSFASWYADHDDTGKAITWPNFLGRKQTVLKSLTLVRGTFDEGTAQFTAGGTSYTFDSRYMKIDGSTPAVIANSNPPIRVDGFFPVDELGTSGKECGGGGRPSPGADHNFHFTSEVRFWFEYDAAASPTLQFSGDDDVWVYVNGHLALDIGGIHGREAKSFTITPQNATAWTLEDGKVYEIAVFQAERNQCASNYWLTLQGFNTSKSVCKSTCGDGIVASDEVCDDGPDNQQTDPPDYGKCSSDCKKRGPNCGDGHVDVGHEACDDGVNTSTYDFDGNGCAPGCVKPPRCGDGQIQATEQCDDGKNDGSYGTCTSECKLAPRCGDRAVQPTHEQCDDGPSGSKNCTPACKKTAPR